MSIIKNLNVEVISPERDGNITVIDSHQTVLDHNVILPEREEKNNTKEKDGWIV